MKNFTDEKTLLREIKNGNGEAFEFLFNSYYPRLRGYAARFVTDEEAVRDIIQESFLRFWEKRDLIEAVSISSLQNRNRALPPRAVSDRRRRRGRRSSGSGRWGRTRGRIRIPGRAGTPDAALFRGRASAGESARFPTDRRAGRGRPGRSRHPAGGCTA